MQMKRNRLGITRDMNARASIEAVIAFLERPKHAWDQEASRGFEMLKHSSWCNAIHNSKTCMRKLLGVLNAMVRNGQPWMDLTVEGAKA
jgi:hypothetical protein